MNPKNCKNKRRNTGDGDRIIIHILELVSGIRVLSLTKLLGHIVMDLYEKVDLFDAKAVDKYS